MPSPPPRRGYADTASGQLHCAESSTGAPLILLHQTPRSHDEFTGIQPLPVRGRRVITMDMYGFGLPAKPPAPQTIEQHAEGVLALAGVLGPARFAVLGHHTGAFVAGEVASAASGRVTALVLSGAEYGDEEFRRAEATADHAPTREDGHHLLQLRDSRRPLYPGGRPGLLDRYVRDALVSGVDPLEGHAACARYVPATSGRTGSSW
ncbi:alpha/beta fold hydrolase [Streptomyces sp. NPDC057236]|uniref:alpha/beta fold hydrolase n=1 Tax=Streptomyces sp. NPDC057236 TaxID=3346059 RepID=UPI00362B454D